MKIPTPSPIDLAELADGHFRRAQLTGDKRDYDQAEALARQSLTILPTPNGAALTLAKLANTRHEFHEALKIAHDYKRKSVAVPTIQATAHLALGNLQAAAEAANAAVAIKPDASTYLMRALVLQAQGRDREVAADFASAVRLEDQGDPQGAARLRSMWGRFLLRRGDLEGAGWLFDEALRIAPEFTLAQALRGELLLRSGKPKDAVTQLEQAFAASRQVRYLIDQARALEAAGDVKNADAVRAQVETIVRAELGEGGLGHRLDLVEVLVDRGTTPRLTEAIALGREEVRRRPSADTRYQLARAYARAGDVAQAMVELQGALATGAHEPQFYELASRLEKLRGDAGRAAMYAKLAAELDPGSHGWRALGMP
ncbi:MAG: hypothetical protein H0V17_18105 [Deltaproteobacteria bacterium]|nr:hypothetical protein [Deltaproteobacteria bacterium]